MSLLFLPMEPSDDTAPTLIENESERVHTYQPADTGVSPSLQAATAEELKAMHPLMLDRYINACARRMFDSQRRYEATGCFADAVARDYWYRAEADALVERGNRPEVVARMERERGLA